MTAIMYENFKKCQHLNYLFCQTAKLEVSVFKGNPLAVVLDFEETTVFTVFEKFPTSVKL